MSRNDQINSWEDLDSEIESLFNTPDSLTTKSFKAAYEPLKSIVAELKNNQEKYKDSPGDFSNLILKSPVYLDNLFGWLPYLSGARAKLVEMKFLDYDGNEITNPEDIRKLLKDNDPEITSKTYFVIYPDFQRVEELNAASLEHNNKIVYADINKPTINLNNIKKAKNKM